MRTWPSDVLAYGGDYNPEQWPREVWSQDIELMHHAGVTFVTLGVFSWSWLEPAKGEYEFEWLDHIMGLLADGGIAVDLATATASPPPWLTTAYPQILPETIDGTRLWPGSRQSWCPSSPIFRDAAQALVTQLAQRYHDHPALAMWHVSNELACHNLPCYCDTCAAAFRVWLEKRYGTIDLLNFAWGTAFWSQRYSDFAQILPPRTTPTFHNPTQVLDFRRFGSDALLDHYLGEKQILNELSPGVPVTTNFMTTTGFRHLDYHQWAPHQDVVSTDHYRVDTLAHPGPELAFQGDVTRGLAGGEPWLVMEHSTSAVNWQPVNPAKAPGQTIRDSLTHVAHGADTIGYFQWRASRAGAEKWHSALVPHAGANSDRFREVVRLGALAATLGELKGSRVEARVAILYDFQAQWATMGPAMPSSEIDYPEVAQRIHRILREEGITCDVVHPSADLSPYAVVIAPTLYLITDADAAAIAVAAERGAQVLITYFSGLVDEHDHVRLGGYPGAFTELLGIRIEEFDPLPAGREIALTRGTGTRWSEFAALVDAEALIAYAEAPHAGRPVVTYRAVGAGAAWYAGTLLDDDTWRWLLGQLMSAGGVEPVARVPRGVEAVRRRSSERSWLFLLNHGTDTEVVACAGHDLISGADIHGDVVLAPGGCAVIREDH